MPLILFTLSPVTLQVIVAYYNPDTNAMRQEVNKWALVFVGLGAFSLGAYTLQHYSFGVVGENLTRRVREAMLRGEGGGRGNRVGVCHTLCGALQFLP